MQHVPPIEIRARSGLPLGMSPAHFLRDYWQKRPLLIRNAFANFANPVAPDDLAGLACEELALSRIAIHAPKHDGWTLRNGPFTAADFAELPTSRWTLLVQDVDKWDADVGVLLDHFRFLPSWRVDDVMVSYAEDGGSVGAHVDQYDVFLLQGLGTRRWQIDSARVRPHVPVRTSQFEPADFRDDAELKLLREFTPTHAWILEPGDMLYLPPGVPHHGVAVGACMTYSIGMRAPSAADLAGDFVDHLIDALPEYARYCDADLAPSRGDGEIDDAAMMRVVRAMPWLRVDVDESHEGRLRIERRADSSGAHSAYAKNRVRVGQRLDCPGEVDASLLRFDQERVGQRLGCPGGVDASLLRFDQERVGQRLGCPGGVDASLLRTWFGRFITRYRSAQVAAPNPRALTDATFARAIAENRRIRRNPWSRVAWLRAGNAARLFVAGDAHPCSLRLAQLIGAQANFALRDAPANARDRGVIRALIDAGHFGLVREGRTRRKR